MASENAGENKRTGSDMMADIRVSVIMPAYNHERYVESALKSIAGQTHQNMELIVINDGSTDGTAEVITEFIRCHPSLDVKYLDQKNQGVCKTLNKGLAMATGDYIAFLSSDDFWRPERVAVQLEFMENNLNIGMVFSDAWLFRDSTGKRYRWSDYKSALPEMFKNGIQNCDMYAQLLIRPLVPALTVLVRRRVLDEVGEFDGELAYEDYDLWLRIAMAYPIAYLHLPLADYRLHADNVSNDARLMLKGVVQTIKKNFRIGPFRNHRLKRWKIVVLLVLHLLADRLNKSVGKLRK